MTCLLVNERYRPFLEGQLPAGTQTLWYDDLESFRSQIAEAEVVWPDTAYPGGIHGAMEEARAMRWCSVMSSGVDWLPLDLLAEREVMLTNGAGLHAHSVAEFAVMGMLSLAKKWRTIVHAQDRGEWLGDPPGMGELLDAEVLVIGAGEIGQRIRTVLEAFDARVTMARRSPREGDLGSDEWRGALGRFDWVIVIVPSTDETRGMFGAEEMAAMKPGAALVNLARGTVIDQDALLGAIDSGHLGGAFLDVTDPEPLPEGHPLWSRDNVEISMHLSGRAQASLFRRGAQRFLDNLAAFERGDPLAHRVDLSRGY